jgi:hypothetical protein
LIFFGGESAAKSRLVGETQVRPGDLRRDGHGKSSAGMGCAIFIAEMRDFCVCYRLAR